MAIAYSNTAIYALDLGDDPMLRTMQSFLPGDKVDDLHITLLFLGDIAKLNKAELISAAKSVASKMAPIDGLYNGLGAFAATDENDGKLPIVALYDSPQLPYLRQALRDALGVEHFPQNHGFTPHTTLAYIKPEDCPEFLYPKEFITKKFSSISLFWGDEHISFDFTGDYVYKELPINDASKSNLLSVRISIFQDSVTKLSERMYTGSVTLGQWEEGMKQLIRELHTSAAAIGKGGWGSMSQSDWGKLGNVLKKQYKFLHNFAQDIAANRDSISLDAILARAKMYGNAARYSAALIAAGILAAMLPWLPGDGSTECLVNCKCFWQLDVTSSDKDTKTVLAVWHLRPAEHCDDCVNRNGYTETLVVPSGTPVPRIIGG